MKKLLVISSLVAVAAVLAWAPTSSAAPKGTATGLVKPGAGTVSPAAPGADMMLARRRVCVRWRVLRRCVRWRYARRRCVRWQRRYTRHCMRWVPAGRRRCVRWQRRYINHRWVRGRCLRWVGGRGRRCVRWVRRWTRGRCLRWAGVGRRCVQWRTYRRCVRWVWR